jgi:hypothetical protein
MPQFELLSIKEYLFSSLLPSYSFGTFFSIITFHLCYIFLLLFLAILIYWRRGVGQ